MGKRGASVRARRLTGVVAVALLCAGAVGGCGPSTSSLRDDVQAYMDALVAGDASAALAVSDEATQEYWADEGPVSAHLLTDKVFQGATEHISDVTVGQVDVLRDPAPGRDARADVSFSLAGSTYDETLFLRRDGEHWKVTWGLMGTITVVDADYRANLPFEISGVDSAGARCGDRHCTPGAGYLLLPGVYHVEVRVDPPWRLSEFNMTAPSQDVTVVHRKSPGLQFVTERVDG
ncbi:hypothetical protein [Cellulomonas citrea]|uniref:hypothetical protein n=1 Tax=Cellulomonas citrea TaxID=1909423 RepID=UPI00135C5E6B|nr:hypothetical protein [Cellulomonas citrea]